jgi:hypothetical protein
MGERRLGWERLGTGPIEVRRTKSNHLGVMSRKNVERMCAVLRKRLDEAFSGLRTREGTLRKDAPPTPLDWARVRQPRGLPVTLFQARNRTG